MNSEILTASQVMNRFFFIDEIIISDTNFDLLISEGVSLNIFNLNKNLKRKPNKNVSQSENV